MKKYMMFVLSLSVVGSLLECSQNLPVVDNKASKSMIAAALIAIAAVPSYFYYRSSSVASAANQKEAQKIVQEIKDLGTRIAWRQGELKELENGTYSPLPKGYQERKKASMEPHRAGASKADYQRDYTEFQKFIAKFAPPVDALDDLVKNEQLIYKNQEEYNTNQNRFFAKMGSDFSRIVNIERMKKLIASHKFEHITVPNKYIFFIGDEFLNIADKMMPYEGPKEPFSKAEIEELANFVAEIGYADFAGKNIFKSANGKWAFICCGLMK